MTKSGNKWAIDLSLVEHSLHNNAQIALQEGDHLSFLNAVDSLDVVEFVVRNFNVLRKRGILEKALVHAVTQVRTNNLGWSTTLLKRMLDRCDRDQLLAAGSPLPGPGPFLVYRGVAGPTRDRRIHGLSWTSSLDTACWFALRDKLVFPAVYFARVTSKRIYTYVNDRNEHEFICSPARVAKLDLSLDEMRLRSDAVKKTRKEEDRRRFIEAQRRRSR